VLADHILFPVNHCSSGFRLFAFLANIIMDFVDDGYNVDILTFFLGFSTLCKILSPVCHVLVDLEQFGV
jgi:hypothetical protein